MFLFVCGGRWIFILFNKLFNFRDVWVEIDRGYKYSIIKRNIDNSGLRLFLIIS